MAHIKKSRESYEKLVLEIYPLFSAYNGSLISSLTSPTLSPKLDTFKQLVTEGSHLKVMTQLNSATQQFMRASPNPYLKQLQKVSDETGQSIDYNLDVSLEIVLNSTNIVYFQDMAYFVLTLNPPSGSGMSKDFFLSFCF